MKYKVVVPMHPDLKAMETGRQNLNIQFPPRCVYCNIPAETFQVIDISGGKTVGKRTADFSAQLFVPYCVQHSIIFSKYKKTMGFVGIPLFLIVFLGWFALMLPFGNMVDEFLPGINILFVPLLFPCIGNLILALVAFALLHYLLLLFNPKFRQIPSAFESGGLGMKVKMNTSLYTINDLTFFFSNQTYAKEFAELNQVPLI